MTSLRSASRRTELSNVLRPPRHKIGHFGDVQLPKSAVNVALPAVAAMQHAAAVLAMQQLPATHSSKSSTRR